MDHLVRMGRLLDQAQVCMETRMAIQSALVMRATGAFMGQVRMAQVVHLGLLQLHQTIIRVGTSGDTNAMKDIKPTAVNKPWEMIYPLTHCPDCGCKLSQEELDTERDVCFVCYDWRQASES